MRVCVAAELKVAFEFYNEDDDAEAAAVAAKKEELAKVGWELVAVGCGA